jgi:hypothetical protein
VCGGSRFAVRPGGAERILDWVASVASVPVRRPARPRAVRDREIVVGGLDDVRDLGEHALDLVAIVDADAGTRRPGLGGRERALATALETVAWAAPDATVIVHATEASDPMIQAVVRGNPDRFLAREREARAAAGFPAGMPVFRVVGDERLAAAIPPLGAETSLVTSLEDRTVCLLALAPGRLPAFGAAMRQLAADGVVERVEAEPHL